MTTSCITIIVCNFNAETTIAGTLESLLGQSHSALRILAIDDGSSDASPAIVQKIAASDPRVRLLFNPENRGTAFTRMRGLQEAETDLVMFFDADDLAEPELVSRLLGKMQADEKTLGVGCYARYFNDGGDLGKQKIGPLTKEMSLDFYSRNKLVFMIPCTLFDRQAALKVGGYRQNILPNEAGIRYEDFAEDLDLWCRMADLGAEGRYFVTIPEPLFRYRKPTNSLSTSSVSQMNLKMRWIKHCLIRRRCGQPELTLADFIASRTRLERFNDARADIAAKYYKKAGFAYSNRRFFRLATYLVIAGVCSPKLVRQKIRTQTTKAA